MFKKIKENEKVIKAKELWKNPKTHDIAVLLFWLIFIFIVIIFVRSMGSSPVPTHAENKTNPNNFANMKSYDFTYKTNDNIINGEAYEDALVFYIDNKRYYYNNQTYLIEENKNLVNYDLGILKITSKMLNSLIVGITPSDNGNFKQYIVPLDRFINLYEIDTDVDLSKAATLNVVISIYLTDNEINKVVLDLTNYYNLKNKTNISPVTIYYYNVNKVSDFRKGYDKIKEVIK